jgi:hypothetical protein
MILGTPYTEFVDRYEHSVYFLSGRNLIIKSALNELQASKGYGEVGRRDEEFSSYLLHLFGNSELVKVHSFIDDVL